MASNAPVVAPLDFSSLMGHNLADPTSAQDSATKNYVDSNTSNGYLTEWTLPTSGYASAAWAAPLLASSPNVGTMKGLTFINSQHGVQLAAGVWRCSIFIHGAAALIAALTNSWSTGPSASNQWVSQTAGATASWAAAEAHKEITSTGTTPVVPWVFLSTGTTINAGWFQVDKVSSS